MGDSPKMLQEPKNTSLLQALLSPLTRTRGVYAGIGRAAVEEFAQLGARVLTCARDENALQAAREAWAGKGLQIEAVIADVADRQAAEQLVETAKKHFGGPPSTALVAFKTPLLSTTTRCAQGIL